MKYIGNTHSFIKAAGTKSCKGTAAGTRSSDLHRVVENFEKLVWISQTKWNSSLAVNALRRMDK